MNEDRIIIDPDEDDVAWGQEEAARKKTVRLLTFSLDKESYCIPLNQAKEVIEPQTITRVPNSPDFIVGVINLRGEITSVLDIRHFFGLGEKEKSKDARVIITDVTGSRIGFMVDGVKAIIDIEEEAVQPTLATLKGKLADYTKGEIQLGNDIFILLDLDKVLNNEAISNLRKGVN